MTASRSRRASGAPQTVTPEPRAGAARWYQDALIYELHVKVFADSNGDGIGDFRGLMGKLDYLQDLGVTAIWLLPFYPSPLRDDGYDTADYRTVHPAYGTLRDFKAFLREAHARGLRVITELVLNHTSDEHPWFQRARRAKPGSAHRDFYVWSDTVRRYEDARIIFKDFEHSNWTWDPVAGAYFWHRFYSHQPDLNWENPTVVRELYRIVDYWFDMGVDGLRLDAVPYLFEREGTNCENLPETHAALRDLRAHVDANHTDKMLLAEANQWPEEAVDYFGSPDRCDECHMAFHFPLMPRMYMAIKMEDRFPIIDILHETPAIPPGAQWATFLRNHDELTLEMVTDEERDYMWRIYAEDPRARINLGIRRRLAPLLGNNRRLIEMMNGLLLSLPGTPVIYYGDEIGMGDNIYLGDRDGVRTPMQWSADRNAGFSSANPQKLYLPVIVDPEYHHQAVNVEAQQHSSESLLWWMKRIVAIRRRLPALSHGELQWVPSENRKVLTYLRCTEDQRILCVANLSRFAQYVELDLSQYEGYRPVNVVGGVDFPAIGELPYLLTLGPHDFYWFVLEPPADDEQPAHASTSTTVPTLSMRTGSWHDLFTSARGRARVESLLPDYLVGRRWFRSKTRRIRSASIVDVVPVPVAREVGGGPDAAGYICVVEVEYADGDAETYVMPLTAEQLDTREGRDDALPPTAFARVRGAGEGAPEWVLYDALYDRRFSLSLLDALLRRRKLGGRHGRVSASSTSAMRALRVQGESQEPVPLGVDQTNSTVAFGDRYVLKVFRMLEEGTNPDVEVGRFLTEHAQFEHAPAVGAAIEYVQARGANGGGASAGTQTLGLLQAFVPNEGDAWRFTLDELDRYFEYAMTRSDAPEPAPAHVVERARDEVPALAQETVGGYLEAARLLGVRTAQMHHALASAPGGHEFEPEPVTALYRRSLFQSLRTSTRRTFQFLRRNARTLPLDADLLALEAPLLERYRGILELDLDDVRIRCHGDYHLGQVLWTGRDFRIIDFEGEPGRAIGERRIKRSALRDVAGMVRSFHYAAYTALERAVERGETGAQRERAEAWAAHWYAWVSAAFLRSYLQQAQGGGFLPATVDDLDTLLEALLLEKATYELAYEANNRPDWMHIPARGLRELLQLDV